MPYSATFPLEIQPDVSVDPCFAEINGSPRVQPMSLRLIMRHLPFVVVDSRLMPRDSIRAGDRLIFCGVRSVTRSSDGTHVSDGALWLNGTPLHRWDIGQSAAKEH